MESTKLAGGTLRRPHCSRECQTTSLRSRQTFSLFLSRISKFRRLIFHNGCARLGEGRQYGTQVTLFRVRENGTSGRVLPRVASRAEPFRAPLRRLKMAGEASDRLAKARAKLFRAIAMLQHRVLGGP